MCDTCRLALGPLCMTHRGGGGGVLGGREREGRGRWGGGPYFVHERKGRGGWEKCRKLM